MSERDSAEERARAEWRTDVKNAPENKAVLVHQPAVRYAGGAFFDAYVTEAFKGCDGRFYSETHNAILEPTEWMPMPDPPNRNVIESPAVGPTPHSFCNVSSAAEVEEPETIPTPGGPEDE